MRASSSAGIKVEALFDFKIGKDPSVSTKALIDLSFWLTYTQVTFKCSNYSVAQVRPMEA